MNQSGLVLLEDCYIQSETARAFLIHYQGMSMWVPKSQMCPNHVHLHRGQANASVHITRWLLEQKLDEIDCDGREFLRRLREAQSHHHIISELIKTAKDELENNDSGVPTNPDEPF